MAGIGTPMRSGEPTSKKPSAITSVRSSREVYANLALR